MSKTKKSRQTYLTDYDCSLSSTNNNLSSIDEKCSPYKKVVRSDPIVCDKVKDSTFYTSDNVKLSYQHCIDNEFDVRKPNIVLLHSIGFDSNYWIYFFNKFYSVSNIYALDFINCGRSDYVKNPARLSLTKLIRDLAEFLDHNTLSKVYLVGHGLGGTIGLYFASVYPNRVIKIVIASASPKYYADTYWPYEISPQLQQLTQELWTKWDESNTDIKSNVKEELRKIVMLAKKITKLVDPVKCNHKHLTKQLINTINGQKIYSQTSFTADARLILEYIEAPVLIMTGTSDPTVPIGASLYLREKIKCSTVIEFHGHGSNFPILDTDTFHHHIFDFFFISDNRTISHIRPEFSNHLLSGPSPISQSVSLPLPYCYKTTDNDTSQSRFELSSLPDNTCNNCLISISNNEKIRLGNCVHIITDRIYPITNGDNNNTCTETYNSHTQCSSNPFIKSQSSHSTSYPSYLTPQSLYSTQPFSHSLYSTPSYSTPTPSSYSTPTLSSYSTPTLSSYSTPIPSSYSTPVPSYPISQNNCQIPKPNARQIVIPCRYTK